MAVDLIMPKLGLTMEEGTVVRWLVTEGDHVEKGQPVLEVETDKVVVEVEATASGVMGPLLVGEGKTVPITTLLARIYAPGEKVEEETSAEEAPAPRITPLARRMAEKEGVALSSIPAYRSDRRVRAEEVPAALTRRPSDSRRTGQRIFSSPRARLRARELGVDWQGLAGSGPWGRVVEKDVLRAAQAATRPSPTLSPALPVKGEERDVTWETPTTVQRITAERMIASFGSAPHFYLIAEVHADALLDLRARLLPPIERRTGVRLTITDLLVKILATALAKYPRANAFWDEGRIGLNRQVNVGVAVATDAGLVVPVLHQADRKLLAQIASERTQLMEKARAGRLSVDDLSDGTFTLTNLGMFRVDAFQAILNPPQSAILAVGRIVERPAVVGGQLVARPMAVLSLSCDHRVLDGALAAQFLGRVVELIEQPYGLLA
ncbi:MAG: 2-oxo acid dehydrogenase subunit E2 [Anaerolineae bacterium]|nr:2-oxo acid dehydrogenase subunit E2 [Anaerolineae bacterium]